MPSPDPDGHGTEGNDAGGPSMAGQLATGASNARTAAGANPVALGLLSAAAGFGFGMVVPLTRQETLRLAPLAERTKGQVKTELPSALSEAVNETGIDAATRRAELAADQAIEAVAAGARKLPGGEAVAGSLEQTAKQAARSATRKVRDKAASLGGRHGNRSGVLRDAWTQREAVRRPAV